MKHRPRKRFGQHFLADPGVLRQLAAAIGLRPGDRVLEIGPGDGALTEALYGGAGRYVAVELDRDLVPLLKARFPGMEVINDDVLRLDLAALLAHGEAGGWRLVGNLPYNISTPLVLHLLDHLDAIADMHFMLQREVAARLAAEPGSKAWGRITVLAQYHCEVEVLFEVGPESFTPPPKVHSAVLRATPRRRKLTLAAPAALDRVLRHAFSSRRKQLGNALQGLEVDFAGAGVAPQRRADDVSVAEYVALANGLAEAETQRTNGA
ncbi:MAG: 16S rRNA (adenine(1518)-N(6)/adenine(1519)-N(6))-dimethyltransferase RsmA [Pseudomonadota bacterium]